MIKDAEALAVYGRRNSGKSYMVKKKIHNHKRLIVFDPMAEYAGKRGWKTVHNVRGPNGLHTAVIKNWTKGFKIAFVVSGNYQEQLHELSSYLWTAQAKAKRKVMLVVEEMNLGYPSQAMKAKYSGFPQLIMQGRHRGIEIIGVTQRPSLVNANFRSNCAASYWFPMEDEIDINVVQRKIGREKLKEYRTMKKHYHMKTENGAVEFGKA